MNKTRNNSEQYSEKKNQRLKKPFVVTLTGVLIVIVALFLPYMTAVGDTAEYIEEHPDRVEIKSLELTASDLANIPLVSVHNLIAGVYGEDDGAIANVIVGVLGGCLTLTMLFVIHKNQSSFKFTFHILANGGLAWKCRLFRHFSFGRYLAYRSTTRQVFSFKSSTKVVNRALTTKRPCFRKLSVPPAVPLHGAFRCGPFLPWLSCRLHGRNSSASW